MALPERKDGEHAGNTQGSWCSTVCVTTFFPCLRHLTRLSAWHFLLFLEHLGSWESESTLCFQACTKCKAGRSSRYNEFGRLVFRAGLRELASSEAEPVHCLARITIQVDGIF